MMENNIDKPVSIHALRVGCDFAQHCGGFVGQGFNPRTPCGVRLLNNVWIVLDNEFQSTHSVWGATLGVCGTHLRCGVSIHALRVGCDPWVAEITPLSTVSIHALRVGCDKKDENHYFRGFGFNPRTPCGVRRLLNCQGQKDYWFQSTHSVWGATFSGPLKATGAPSFNPRTPCGVRLTITPEEYYQKTVSIHALRVGCDLLKPIVNLTSSSFNPRTPCGVRPDLIHRVLAHQRFQSTHSVWGATGRGYLEQKVPRGFNPRTPCGVRRVRSDRLPGCTRFQSTHSVWGATGGNYALRAGCSVSIHALRVGCDPTV